MVRKSIAKVKSFYWKITLTTISASIYSFSIFSQITPDTLRQFILDDNSTGNVKIEYLSDVRKFYAELKYKTAWIGEENLGNCKAFLNALKLSPVQGLHEKDYQFNFIASYSIGAVVFNNINDSIAADIRITDAAIHFYTDLAYGNQQPEFSYAGLDYKPACQNIAALLAHAISTNSFQSVGIKNSHQLPEVAALENKIRWFYTLLTDSGFSEVTITSAKVNKTNKSLVSKLYQLELIDSIMLDLPERILVQKIKEAQRQFNLVADGVLRSTTIEELNIPLHVRFQQLTISLNYYRWLYCLSQARSVIVVNIPAAYMKVYRKNEVFLEMRLVVGKKSTPTPTLTSTITDVILYPYWHVPNSIATKELLPVFKRNPGFIDSGNFQVLSKTGAILNPNEIKWHQYSSRNFPFIIRQSTGCDNALGLLKLNFYNPFNIYLHDTPQKSFFLLNRRYFSHGCLRMEKPMELGHIILSNNHIAIDTLEQKGCLSNQSPTTVPADEHLPVVVWYVPAGVDSTGRVIFYEDVYGKFGWIKKEK